MHFVIFHTFHSLKSTFLPLDFGHFITGAGHCRPQHKDFLIPRSNGTDCRLPPLASPRGKPRGRNHALLPFNEPLCSVSFGRMLSAPTRAHLLKLYYWIKMFKLGSGLIRTKLPIHSLLGCVSSGMPCGQTFIEVINGRNAHIQQALGTERG